MTDSVTLTVKPGDKTAMLIPGNETMWPGEAIDIKPLTLKGGLFSPTPHHFIAMATHTITGAPGLVFVCARV